MALEVRAITIKLLVLFFKEFIVVIEALIYLIYEHGDDALL